MNYAIFDSHMAKQIIDFVYKYKDRVGLIICQCEAGISRSAGVAAALSKHFNGDDSFFFNNYLPNSLVYKTLLNELSVKNVKNKTS